MGWSFHAGLRSVEFTGDLSGVGLMSEPEVKLGASAEMFELPRRDGLRPGEDRMRGQVVTLQVECRADHRSLDEVWRELVSVWRADEVRGVSGAVAVLVSGSGRRAYGRPRPIRPEFVHKLFGIIRVELEFEAISDLWFGPLESTRVRFSVPETGGLTFPAEAPFTFDSGPTVRNGVVVVGGDAPTAATYVLQGPVTDPSVHVREVGLLQLDTTILFDQAVTVNTRDGYVTRDGLPIPGVVSTAGARLSDMWLSPGSYEVALRGYDPSGTGYLDVQVEPAFTSF